MEVKLDVGNKTIYIVQGDITDSESDAIVNAANNHLWMGAGVAGAIKRKGGQAIEEEAIKQGPINAGEAVITHAGQLKAKYVIHAAAMGQDLKTSKELIETTTWNTLQLADKNKIESIAFPALGTGVGGFPIDNCARIMIKQAYVFLENSVTLNSVSFVLFDKNSYDSFVAIISDYNK